MAPKKVVLVPVLPVPSPAQIVAAPAVNEEEDDDNTLSTLPLPQIKMRVRAPVSISPMPTEETSGVSEPPAVVKYPVPVPPKVRRVTSPSPVRQSSSDLITLLKQNGYDVLLHVCSGTKIYALKASTVYGEWVLLLLDKPAWQNLSSDDTDDNVWRATATVSTLPEVVKTGYNAAVDPSSAGVVIEQGGEMCVLVRETLESVPKEHVFQLKHATGKSICAYPVLRISELLQSPATALKSVRTNTQSLAKYVRQLVDTRIIESLNKVRSIATMLEVYSRQESKAMKQVSSTYNMLVQWYDEYQSMEQTKEITDKQARVAENIRVRQDALRRLSRAAQTWASERIQSFLQELETKLEDDIRYASEVEKGDKFNMVE